MGGEGWGMLGALLIGAVLFGGGGLGLNRNALGGDVSAKASTADQVGLGFNNIATQVSGLSSQINTNQIERNFTEVNNGIDSLHDSVVSGNQSLTSTILNTAQHTDDMVSSVGQCVNAGFNNTQQSLCNGFAGVNSTVNSVGRELAEQCCNSSNALQRDIASTNANLQNALCCGFAGVNSNLANGFANLNANLAAGVNNLTLQGCQNTNTIVTAVNGLGSKMDQNTITQLSDAKTALQTQLLTSQQTGLIDRQICDLKQQIAECCCKLNNRHNHHDDNDVNVILNNINRNLNSINTRGNGPRLSS